MKMGCATGTQLIIVIIDVTWNVNACYYEVCFVCVGKWFIKLTSRYKGDMETHYILKVLFFSSPEPLGSQGELIGWP